MTIEPAHRVRIATCTVRKADQPDQPGYGAAQDKNEQGVLSENVAESAPGATGFAELDKVDEECQAAERPARGYQHIAARPDLFVDREEGAPAIPGKQQDHCGN